MGDAPVDMQESLDRYRGVRRQLEEKILPLATSVDGRRFSYQTSLHGLELQAGSYVVLEQDLERRLGQVVTLEVARHPAMELAAGDSDGAAHRAQVVIRSAEGDGRILSGDGLSFHDATVRPATSDEVREHLEETASQRARLEVGELLLAPGVPFSLDAGGFGRHTFLCGQSGSGKTYSLGVVLEQLLLETDLQIVVLDPNSDFARLGEVRPDVDDASAARYSEATRLLAVRRAGDGLALLLAELEPTVQAAALRLDPVADRGEYAELAALTESGEALSLEQLQLLEREGSEEARNLISRARNLGLHRWGIWAGTTGRSILPELARDDLRCLVVDLGSLATREEQALGSAAVLGELWRRREERRPVLVVVDEAHNVCPARPEDPLTAIATEYAVRIASEGRKFGLYLLVSTQRPQKVHENVLSQCDNLLLMRMNSLADLGFVSEVFSFVPPSLLDRATTFRQGESLVAGPVAPHPAYLRFGQRLAQEGGGDVPADWSRPKA